MVNADLVNSGDFEKITALSREAVRNLLGFTVPHIGLNAGSGEAAMNAAKLFGSLFGFPANDGNTSVFAGEKIEIMKLPSAPGKYGHIALGTNSLKRAKVYLERKGITFDPDSVKKDAGGNISVIYCREEILGFALHLVQKK
jgi:2-dehydro-3-deoxyphosphogluconate aldolase/(4S)-4-hydroxy-2-oxoglutarate aldolase